MQKYWIVVGVAALSWLSPPALLAEEVRTAKVAGEFYPDDRTELRDLVKELLARQPEPLTPQKPRILIVPHAGYEYSGLVAANGFRQVQGQSYDGVVVVGFLHQSQFDGASVETREAYETPLGRLPIHQEAAAILQTYPGISHIEEAHESGEHSLEAELPFIQVALGHTRIIPVLMGNVRLEDARRLADALAGLARLGDYLFVFSTDLSHYHPYDQAERIDEGTVNAILLETPQAVEQLFAHDRIEACGQGPVLTSLLLSAKLGYLKRQLFYYANSGDTTGDPRSVVGYAAIGMFDPSTPPARLASPNEAAGVAHLVPSTALGARQDSTPRAEPVGLHRPPASTGRLSPAAGRALVQAARQTLERSLAHLPIGPPISLERYPELSRASGLFVTLRKRGELRGCIGRIQTNEPLTRTLPIVALDAALHDSRFQPVSAAELRDLQIEVSVLTPPVAIQDPKEIVAGRDGVILESQGHRGVFLPQVWEETGWTRAEFLRELSAQKAGLAPDDWQHANLSIFQAQAFEE